MGDDLEKTLDSHLNRIVWKGPNADKFRAAWEEFTLHFDTLHSALDEGRDDIRTQHNDIALATGESASI
jgi:hypothetical protein